MTVSQKEVWNGTMNEQYETAVEITWLALVLGGMALGLGAVAYVLIDGQGIGFFGTPLDPVWGVLVATYEFFVIVSGGLGLASVPSWSSRMGVADVRFLPVRTDDGKPIRRSASSST